MVFQIENTEYYDCLWDREQRLYVQKYLYNCCVELSEKNQDLYDSINCEKKLKESYVKSYGKVSEQNLVGKKN